MKVWSVPVNLPDPEKEPKEAEAANAFIGSLKGVKGVCPNQDVFLLVFGSIEDARAAKWRIEEFAPCSLPLIEGSLSADGKTLNCTKVVKG